MIIIKIKHPNGRHSIYLKCTHILKYKNVLYSIGPLTDPPSSSVRAQQQLTNVHDEIKGILVGQVESRLTDGWTNYSFAIKSTNTKYYFTSLLSIKFTICLQSKYVHYMLLAVSHLASIIFPHIFT